MNALQEPHTNERRSRCDEGLLDACGVIRSQPQLTKTMQPRSCAFDDPTINAKSATAFRTAVCEPGTDASRSHRPPMRLRIVRAVAKRNIRTSPRMSNLAAYIGDAIHHMRQCFDVVNVGAGDRHGQRNALGVRDDVMLCPHLSTIRRIFACFFASTQGPCMRAVYGGSRSIDAIGFLKFRQENLMKSLPDAGPLPGVKIIPARHAAATAHLLGKFLPGNAGFQHKDNPSEDLTSIDLLASWVTKTSPY